MAHDLIIGLVGLPSAGKSTIINSLLSARVAQTGICRTTKTPHVYGNKTILDLDFTEAHLTSDDKINYSIVDFPGINDFEDKGSEFDKITLKYIEHVDIIMWVTDINSAFNTKYEHEEFYKIYEHLNKLSLKNGKGYQFCILISKCNTQIEDPIMLQEIENIILDETQKPNNKYVEIDENVDEDTTYTDVIKKIKTNYIDKNIINNILLFNAHGRILHNKQSASKSLLKTINANTTTQFNVDFNLKNMSDNYYPTQQQSLLRMILETKIIKEILNSGTCCHGNNPKQCTKTMLLCKTHGYCQNSKCTIDGNRQWCTDDLNKCGCNILQHNCNNRTINGRGTGMCGHNQAIGNCGNGCIVSLWMYCHHGFKQTECNTCLKYLHKFVYDKIDVKKCVHNNDSMMCIVNFELCKIHGKCKKQKCTLNGNRQWCTTNDSYKNCQHNHLVYDCTKCIEDADNCKHGLTRNICDDCKQYLYQPVDKFIVNNLTDEKCVNQLFDFLMITSQEELNKYTQQFLLSNIEYNTSYWNQLSVIISHNNFTFPKKIDEMDKNVIFRIVNLCGINNLDSVKLFYDFHKKHKNVTISLANAIIPWNTITLLYTPDYNKYNHNMLHEPNIMELFSQNNIDSINKIRELLGNDTSVDIKYVIYTILADSTKYHSLF